MPITYNIDLTNIAIDADSSASDIYIEATVASGLTAFRPAVLRGDGTAGRVIIFSSEL